LSEFKQWSVKQEFKTWGYLAPENYAKFKQWTPLENPLTFFSPFLANAPAEPTDHLGPTPIARRHKTS
jgi:hypothetical protein